MSLLKKITLSFLFSLLVFSYTSTSVNAQTEISQTQLSDSIFSAKEVSYDMRYYSMNINQPGKLIPKSVWASKGSYSGYLYLKSWYISKTHYVVTYSGQLRKGPYVPNVVIQDEPNFEGGTLNE